MARKRRTKAEILAAESKGLGDTVEKVLEVTGVAKVAKWLLGEPHNFYEQWGIDLNVRHPGGVQYVPLPCGQAGALPECGR